MTDEYFEDDKDPDYKEFHKKQAVDRTKLKEEDTKNKTIGKIRSILLKQFKSEIEAKEDEISLISTRIADTRIMLDRLRAYVVASYYGSGENVIPTAKAVPRKRRKTIEENSKVEDSSLAMIEKSLKNISDSKNERSSNDLVNGDHKTDVVQRTQTKESKVVNRFYMTQEIIVGNVSKYLGEGNRKENDKSTHKWMVYVRGPAHDPDISNCVKSVWFFLHPSYIPNDIVQVNKPPFQLTRRGWGEFPVRVQLHFNDSQNKRFDIIHNLKLDKTYTGLQTLGAETIVHLELHRHTKDNHLIGNPVPTDTSNLDVEVKGNTEHLNHKNGFSLKTDFKGSNDNVLDLISCAKNGAVELRKQSLLNNKLEEIKQENVEISSSQCDMLHMGLLNRRNELQLKPPSSVVSSCVTSASTSRCCSPVTSCRLPKIQIFDSEIDSTLRRLVTNARLISPNKKFRFRSFTCESLEQYRQWSFSKRRASEWQRACFLKKLFNKHRNESNKMIESPTTKQLMIWCRKNAYTPPEKKLKVITTTNYSNFCSLCGTLLDETDNSAIDSWCKKCMSKIHVTLGSFDTKSSWKTMLDSIRLKEETLKSLKKLECSENDGELDNYIDVINVETKANSRSPAEVEIVSSNELDWIYETVNDIDIHLPTLTINGVKGPFLHAMLLTAVKCFVSELLRKSYSFTGEYNKSTLEPSMITFYHVFKSIQNTPKFDFLTDSYIAKREDENINSLDT